MDEKKVLAEIHQSIPSIEFSSLDEKSVNLSTLIGRSLSLVVYFNSTCPLCQSEAELLVTHFQDRENLDFIFIFSEPVAEIRGFKESNHLEKLENVVFLSDTLFQFAHAFKLPGTPATFLYDTEGKLVKEFMGTFNMQELKDAIAEVNGD
ncbi:peroxiredoxin family protein [Algoriphagus winogradskyi]